MKGFLGCGNIWMPSSPGQHKIRVQLWKPELGTDSLRGTSSAKIYRLVQFLFFIILEAFLPTYHDLDSIRSLVLDPSARSQLQVRHFFNSHNWTLCFYDSITQCSNSAIVDLEINVLCSNYDPEDIAS